MGWGGNNFFNVVIIGGGGITGLFQYQGPPGHGNPPILWAVPPSVTTDPFHNSLPVSGGITSEAHGGGLLAQLFAGEVIFGDTLSADPLTYSGLMRIIHMVAHGHNPILAMDSPAADSNQSHSSLWMIGEPSGGSGPVQSAIFGFNTLGPVALEDIICLGPGGRLTFGSIATGVPTGQSMMWLAPSGDSTGFTDATTLNQAFGVAGYSYVFLLPGTYYLNATVTLGVGQYLIGSGMAGTNGTVVNWVGTGDCFRQSTFSSSGYSGLTTMGGGVQNLVIDGASHTAGASAAIHAGEIESLSYDRTFVRNFSGTGDIGYHFDNQYGFTERMQGSIRAINCATAVVFDVTNNSGGSPDSSAPSFARTMLDIFIVTFSATQAGVVVQAGALLYDCRINIYGNFTGAGSGSAAPVLQVTGTVPVGHPGAGAGSEISLSILNIGVETTAGTVEPQTINFGGGSNTIQDCQGVLDFGSQGLGTFAASNNSGNLLWFNGPIRGDTSLFAQPYYGSETFGVPVNGGTYFVGVIPFAVSPAPAAGVTGMILQAGQRPGQRCWVANSGTGSITFAVAATSHVSTGASVVIAAGTAAGFIWEPGTALWYRT